MDLITFCRENSITSTHVRVDKPKEGVPMSFSRVAHILQILVDINNHPLYVHCNDGTIVTGVVILCLRKLQLWTSASSVSEYRRYMREESIGESEMVFLEKFQGEIELPMILPDWLWGGAVLTKKHPSIKLKHAKFLGSSPSSVLGNPTNMITNPVTSTVETSNRADARPNNSFPSAKSGIAPFSSSGTESINSVSRIAEPNVVVSKDNERSHRHRLEVAHEGAPQQIGHKREQKRVVIPEEEDDESLSLTLQALALELPSSKKSL